MAVLTVQPIVEGGVTPTFSTAGSGGDSFANSGYEYVELITTTASATVTITPTYSAVDVPGMGTMTKAPLVYALGTAARLKAGPFGKTGFNDGQGRVNLSYSAVAGLTVAAFRLPPVNP